MIRIASTNQDVLSTFSSAVKEAEIVLLTPNTICDRLGDADLFLLSDQEALAIAQHCQSESRPTLVVAVKVGEALPQSFAEGLVDDLVLLPLRELDVERLLHMHEHMQALRAVEQTSRAVPELVKKLQEDIQLAQKIQRRLIREKFPPMQGLNVKSKYWCGLKAGGDYFDVFEFPDKNHVGIILSDSSSYALSTGFIGSLVQFSVHVSQDDLSDPSRIVAALYGKLKESMKEKDHFSIFYGILNRKTFQLRYVDCGTLYAGHRNKNGMHWITKGETPALSLSSGIVPPFREVFLEPGDRMMLLSDGWGESIGSPMAGLLEGFLAGDQDSQDVINQMAFSLRKGVEKLYELESEEEFPMPPQDCSVLLFDLAKNALRLAKS